MKAPKKSKAGFTLAELMVASSIAALVSAVGFTLLIFFNSAWRGISLRLQADRDVNFAMNYLVYGKGSRLGLRCAVQGADFLKLTQNSGGWSLKYQTRVADGQVNTISWSATDQKLRLNPGDHVLGSDISQATMVLSRQPKAGSDSPIIMALVTLRVDRVKGRFKARREIASEVYFRNELL